jgi:integrase
MEKVGRNAPCPCGSGKKYKRCCRPTVPDIGLSFDFDDVVDATTDADFQKLLDRMPDDDMRHIAIMGRETGLPLSTILLLQWDDIDFENHQIRVPDDDELERRRRLAYRDRSS